MNYSKWIAAIFCTIALQGTAIAEIYESEDAEGVTEFSDTPTAGSEEVTLPQTNTADAPPDIPAAPAAPQAASPRPAPAPEGAATALDEPQYVDDGGYDEDARERRRLDEDRINNALPGEQRPAVGEPGRPATRPAGEAHPAAGAHPHHGGRR